jgi:hypothetical protein
MIKFRLGLEFKSREHGYTLKVVSVTDRNTMSYNWVGSVPSWCSRRGPWEYNAQPESLLETFTLTKDNKRNLPEWW